MHSAGEGVAGGDAGGGDATERVGAVRAEDARHRRRLVQRVPQRENAASGAHEQPERARCEVAERIARQRCGSRLAARRVREERPPEPDAQSRRTRRAAEPLERRRGRVVSVVRVGRLGRVFRVGVVRVSIATPTFVQRAAILRDSPRAPSLARREFRALVREATPRRLLGGLLERRPEPNHPAARPDEARAVHCDLLVVIHSEWVIGTGTREQKRPRSDPRVVAGLDRTRAPQRKRVAFAERSSRVRVELFPRRLFPHRRHLVLLVHWQQVVHRKQVVLYGVPVGLQSAEQRVGGFSRRRRRRVRRRA